jgi:energy-coupling factor transporter ATP-binding protein EcfA2
MRIARLAFKEIGPFDEAVFAFPEPAGQGELVLFEGPNGSGKTTIVEAIASAAAPFILNAFKWLNAPLSLAPLELPPLEPPPLERRFRSSSGEVGCIVDESITMSFRGERSGAAGQAGWDFGLFHFGVPFGAGARPRKLDWAAFAFGGHQSTADLTTEGAKVIAQSPFDGALSFGRDAPASSHLGQLLTNLENERTKALTYARERPDPQRQQGLERLAESRREALGRFEQVLSEVLDRRVSIEFSIDQQAPEIRFDGELIPLDLLGEGMRSTLSWLSNLLVRLERVPWEDAIRSPLDQDFWLILDEIDESLHPRLQARILPALRRLLPNARIYATTHSPFVVASLGEGAIFPIRPGPDHRVRGEVLPRRLEPGQSLELVTSEIFDVPAEFIDADTREKLAAHERDIRALERQGEIDWSAFLARRTELMRRNDEVRTAVSMQELPVRQAVLRRVREQDEGSAG